MEQLEPGNDYTFEIHEHLFRGGLQLRAQKASGERAVISLSLHA